MLQTLDAYLEKLAGLPQDKVDKLYEEAKSVIGDTCWIPNPGPQTAAGLDDAIIGVSVRCGQPPIVVYSVDRVIEILMARDGMTNDEAIKFFEFNIEGAWTGVTTPVWMYPISGDGLQVYQGFCSQIVDKSPESLNAIRED